MLRVRDPCDSQTRWLKFRDRVQGRLQARCCVSCATSCLIVHLASVSTPIEANRELEAVSVWMDLVRAAHSMSRKLNRFFSAVSCKHRPLGGAPSQGLSCKPPPWTLIRTSSPASLGHCGLVLAPSGTNLPLSSVEDYLPVVLGYRLLSTGYAHAARLFHFHLFMLSTFFESASA